MILKFLLLGLFSVFTFNQSAFAQTKSNAGSFVFWTELQKLCGKAYAGMLVSAPENDVDFKGKELVMHVRACQKTRVRIPFFVGANKSRTWVFVPGEYFTYNLRRMGTDRFFSIKFDLTKEAKTPTAPWGWKN